MRDTPSSWPGPVPAHVGFAHAHSAAAQGGHQAGHMGHTGHVASSPLLGSSPSSSSMPGCCAPAAASSLLGTSPHLMSVSWGAGEGHSRSSSAGGVLGANGHSRALGPECSALSFMSASPAGSCSSSWTGTSPLAAALASGISSLPPPAALRGASGSSGGSSWPLAEAPAGTLAKALAAVGADGMAVGEEQAAAEEPVLADYSQLPEKCWMDILQRLGVRELCCAARVNT